jgi:hypothetical protein
MPDAAPRPLTAPDVVAGLLADVAARDERLAEVTAERDKAYRERAHLVAYLAAAYPAQWADEGSDWPVVYVQTPAGQMSWHIARADQELFGHVRPMGEGTAPQWDGHTTEAKYERLAELTRMMAASPDLAMIHGQVALAARVRAVIARYKDDQVNPITAFADIMDAAGEGR